MGNCCSKPKFNQCVFCGKRYDPNYNTDYSCLRSALLTQRHVSKATN